MTHWHSVKGWELMCGYWGMYEGEESRGAVRRRGACVGQEEEWGLCEHTRVIGRVLGGVELGI